jgi:hypothetical protein
MRISAVWKVNIFVWQLPSDVSEENIVSIFRGEEV